MSQVKISSKEIKKVSFDYGLSLTASRKFLMLHKMKRKMLDKVGELRGSIMIRLSDLNEVIEDESSSDHDDLKARGESSLFTEIQNSVDEISECVSYLFDKEIDKVAPRRKRFK